MATSARNPVKQSENPLYIGGLANEYSYFIFFERQDQLVCLFVVFIFSNL